MRLEELARQWPYCYHITFYENFDPIVTFGRVLYPAGHLLTAAGFEEHRRLRSKQRTIRVWGRQVVLRNQTALNPASLVLPEGESVEDYVAFLNDRTYFWPGTQDGPVMDGLRMFTEHGRCGPALVIRVLTLALIEHNRSAEILAAMCNTGKSPADPDQKAWRKRDTVVPLSDYTDDAAAVVELSYRNAAKLPDPCEYTINQLENWNELPRSVDPRRTLPLIAGGNAA